MRVQRFFPPDAQARISEAVRRAEVRSEGQIVPVVVERSRRYREATFRGALAAAALATAVALLAGPRVGAPALVLIQLAALAAGALLARADAIARLLLGRRALHEAVVLRALRAFRDHGLAHTRRRTGVLVFASLLEQSAVVLGDEAVDRQMGEEGWRAAVQALIGGIRAGDPVRGFVDAVDGCGAVLERAFPRTASPPGNELADRLRIDPL
jgi:putative membrane protein